MASLDVFDILGLVPYLPEKDPVIKNCQHRHLAAVASSRAQRVVVCRCCGKRFTTDLQQIQDQSSVWKGV